MSVVWMIIPFGRAPVRGHHAPSGGLRVFDRLDRLADRADLIHLLVEFSYDTLSVELIMD